MDISLIFVGICLAVSQIVGLVVCAALAKRYIEAKQAEIEARAEAVLRAWIEAKPGEPSKLAELVAVAGDVIGSAAAKALLKSLGQANGAVGNVATGVAAPLEAQANPLLALLAGGRRAKGSAVLRLAELLGPMLAGVGHKTDNGRGGEEPRQGSFSL